MPQLIVVLVAIHHAPRSHDLFFFIITPPPKPDFRWGGAIKSVLLALPAHLASAGG
jgi:hypothetical protein